MSANLAMLLLGVLDFIVSLSVGGTNVVLDYVQTEFFVRLMAFASWECFLV